MGCKIVVLLLLVVVLNVFAVFCADGTSSSRNVWQPINQSPVVVSAVSEKSELGQRRPFSNRIEELPNQEVSPPSSSTTTKPAAPTLDDDLRNFSEGLLKKDTNNAFKFITVNYQGKTTSRSQKDEAPLPLLNVSSEASNVATISKLKLLYNNYILETNVNEHSTGQEKIEENDLLDAMLSTNVMQATRNFLVEKGKISKDPKEFKDVLKQMWFTMYSRSKGKVGSSGFEHVFLTEIKNGSISGLHNWIYFGEEETKHRANYLGYMKKIEFANKGAIIKYHFKYNNIDKPVGSMFIGTSPELELALYSTCFLLKPNVVCPLRLDGNNFIIRTFSFRYRGKNLIGSAFPEI